MQRRRLKLEVMVMLALCSTVHATPPPPIASGVSDEGSDDDVVRLAPVAIEPRWFVAAPDVSGTLWRDVHVARVCRADEQEHARVALPERREWGTEWGTEQIASARIERPRTSSSGAPYVFVSKLDPENIRRIVREHAGQVRHCYESQLQRDPHLAGMLTMRWTIAIDGSVSQAEIVDSELRNDAVAACLVACIETWVFPIHESVGSVIVNYPIVFRRAPKPRNVEKPHR